MDFDHAVERVMLAAGGSALMHGPGGSPRKFGLSAAAYPGEDIAGMTIQRAKELYRRDFWGPAGCDAVPDVLKLPLFETAVQHGPRRAIRALQYAVGELEDGVLGPKTLMAVSTAHLERVLFKFLAARLVQAGS